VEVHVFVIVGMVEAYSLVVFIFASRVVCNITTALGHRDVPFVTNVFQ
jgi:hypothetical protein